MLPISKCALCHELKELQDSHYAPQALYATAREPSIANPNPVIVSNGVMLQTSDQLSDYLLCSDCEELLDKNGEKWVLARIPNGYNQPFLLREALRNEQPVFIDDGINIYSGAAIPFFDMDKISYFGMSIFWRGAVHEWKDRTGVPAPSVDLCGYEEPIRQFLLGGTFPKDVSLEVFICLCAGVAVNVVPDRCPFARPAKVLVLHWRIDIHIELRDGNDGSDKTTLCL